MLKKITIFRIFTFWILVGALLSAQTVTAIKFEGLAQLSPNMAKEIADIHIGEEMSAEKVNDSIKKLFAQGYFDDISVDKRGGTLTYRVKEKLSIGNLNITGYGTGDDGKKLLQGIGLKKGDLYDERKVNMAKASIHTQLQTKGYYDTVVEVSTKPIGKSSVSVIFQVNKGEKVTIKKMNIVGSKDLVKSDIELDLANKEEDWWGWLPWRNSGEASVEQLKYDAFRVRDAYMREGYLDAVVSEPLMRVDFGSYNAEVDYKVVEGVQYRVGTISITETMPQVDANKLKSILTLKDGNVFNIKKMRKDIKKLEEEVGNYGFAYAKVIPQMQKDTKNKRINLQYIVQQGEEVTINDVLITGNDSTKDRVIRRYIYLAPGDKFNATDLKESKSALGRTGFFEKVEIQQQRVSPNKINLLVTVKETSTGTISVGGGYGSYEGLMVNASISDKNIFGSGINATLGFELSKISKNYNLSFVNPKVWDSMYSLSMSFYKRDYEYIEYKQDQIGGSISVGKELMRHLHGSIGVGYVDNKSTYNSNYASTLINYYNDKYKKTSLYASLSFDNTDDYYVPREGVKAILNLEYGMLDGSDHNVTIYPNGYSDIIKTNIKLGLYYGLEDYIDYDLILRAKGRFINISSNGDEYIPIAERVFMGGVGSVRGYEPYSISPTITGDRIGGTTSASMSLEASVPLSKAAKMRLAFFYDYGMIGSTDIPNGTATPNTFSNMTRSSAGVVLEWQSAFGPINLIFAQALDDEAGDRTAVFEFSMGSKF